MYNKKTTESNIYLSIIIIVFLSNELQCSYTFGTPAAGHQTLSKTTNKEKKIKRYFHHQRVT